MHQINRFLLHSQEPHSLKPYYSNVRNFGKLPRLRETSATSGKTTTKKIGFYFFTYEWSRRRLPLIKMINGVEEVFVFLFPRWITNTCFGSTVLRVSKVRLFKDSIGLSAHEKKKDGKPKKNWRKNVSTKVFRDCMGFKV